MVSEHTGRSILPVTDQLTFNVPAVQSENETEATGRPEKISSYLREKPATVIVPVDPECSDLCDNLIQTHLRIRARLPWQSDYRVLFISVRPGMAPAEVEKIMADHKKKVPAVQLPEYRWYYASAEERDRLLSESGVPVVKKGENYKQTAVSVFVDRDGQIVRYLYGAGLEPVNYALALYDTGGGHLIADLISYHYRYLSEENAYRLIKYRVLQSGFIVSLLLVIIWAVFIMAGRRLTVFIRNYGKK